MEMIEMETDTRAEDNSRLMKDLGNSARGLEVGMAAPVRLVAGNKCDLKESRVISAKDGLEYARKHNSGFMETSAREMVNIEETFARMSPFQPGSHKLTSLSIGSPCRRGPPTTSSK